MSWRHVNIGSNELETKAVQNLWTVTEAARACLLGAKHATDAMVERNPLGLRLPIACKVMDTSLFLFD